MGSLSDSDDRVRENESTVTAFAKAAAWTTAGATVVAGLVAFAIDVSNTIPTPEGVKAAITLVGGGATVTTCLGYAEGTFKSVVGKVGAGTGITIIAGGSLLFNAAVQDEREYLERYGDSALETTQHNVAVVEASAELLEKRILTI